MYGIFTYIWVIFRVNVGKYSIHGADGYIYIYILYIISTLYHIISPPLISAGLRRLLLRSQGLRKRLGQGPSQNDLHVDQQSCGELMMIVMYSDLFKDLIVINSD